MKTETRATHTAGPWSVATGGGCELGAGLYVNGPFGSAVAFASSGEPSDARLIAAAPDMLQALREVAGDHHHLNLSTGRSECVFCCMEEGAHDPDCTMNFVLAAIAKGEGR